MGMVKVLWVYLILLIIPLSGWSEPSEILDELILILTELEIAQTELNQGIETLTMGLDRSNRAVIEQQEQLDGLELSLDDYKTNVEKTVIPIVEDQARQLTGLKILAIGTSIVAVGGIVTAILVAILK